MKIRATLYVISVTFLFIKRRKLLWLTLLSDYLCIYLFSVLDRKEKHEFEAEEIAKAEEGYEVYFA